MACAGRASSSAGWLRCRSFSRCMEKRFRSAEMPRIRRARFRSRWQASEPIAVPVPRSPRRRRRSFGSGDGLEDEWDGGAYAQIVAQFARRWFVGVRGDVVGVPSSSVLARAERVGLSLTFQGSEFSRVRGYLEAEHATAPSSAFLPQAMPQWAPAAYLQLEFSIGAHGAHSY